LRPSTLRNVKELLGNGQPGRIQRMEADQQQYRALASSRLTALEEHKAISIGKHSVAAAALATVISLAIEMHDHIGNALRALFR
jgi:hypothetical protein